MKFLAEYIMRGRIQAMLVATSLALLSLLMPPISIVSSATVALVTLRRGATEGLYVLLSASVMAGLMGIIFMGNYQFALAYALILWLPVWLISIILRESRQLSLAVEIAVIFGIISVGAYYLYDPTVASQWQSLLTQVLPVNAAAPIEDITLAINTMAHYMTGILAAGTVFSVLFGLFLGRWWQANLYNPGGFKQEYLSLSTQPKFALGSLFIIAVAALSQGLIAEIAWNASILLFVLYSVIGSSVAHTLFATMKMARFSVPMFYITLFLIPHTLIPVALVGILDAWLNLRKSKSN